MNKQEKYDRAYLKMASEWSQLSYCERRKVGALIVKGRMIISDGYNGTPSGFENICEDDAGYTKWYVLHAEANAILKVAGSTQSCEGATLYLTMSPCTNCSKLIHQAGIKRVVLCFGVQRFVGGRLPTASWGGRRVPPSCCLTHFFL
jgi:dCMP deaminase